MTKDLSSYKAINVTILILLSAIVYVNSLGNGFALDDIVHIRDNVNLTSVRSIWAYFFEPIFPWNLYRPFVQSSYHLTHSFFGLNPFPYHLVNLVSHTAVTVAVFFLCLFAGQQTAFIAAMLFAILPIHTEAVANISGRYELWAALGSILTLTVATKQPWRKRDNFYLQAIFLVALLSKESAIVTIPLIILILWYQSRVTRETVIERLLPAFSALGIYLLLRLVALKDQFISSATTVFSDNPLIDVSTPTRIYNALSLLGKYITLSVVGSPLSADYSYAEIIPSPFLYNWTTTAAAIIVLLLLIVTVVRVKQRTVTGFALAWFFISFLITANIFFPIGTIFGERLAYLPSLGICLLLAGQISKFTNQLRLLIFAVLIVFFGKLTIDRNLAWRDDTTLHNAQIEISPYSSKTQYNYAMALRANGNLQQAEKYLENALSIYPDNIDAIWGLAILSSDKGDLSETKSRLDLALSKNPTHQRSLNSLVRLYLRQNQITDAETVAKHLMNSWGDEFESKLTYLGVLIAKGDKEPAKKLSAHLLDLSPNNTELLSLIYQGKKRGVLN